MAGRGKEPPSLRRTLTLTAALPVLNLWFRAAAATKIEPAGGGWFRIDGEWRLRVDGPGSPRVRHSGGKQELLIPVRFDGNRARKGKAGAARPAGFAIPALFYDKSVSTRPCRSGRG